jgi:hypothetical protein
VYAEAFTTDVDIELSPVEEAQSYEIEFKDRNGHTEILKTRKNQLRYSAACGQYTVRARTINKKNIVGQWGTEMAFEVFSKAVKKLSPEDKKTIVLNNKKSFDIILKWEPRGHEALYEVIIRNQDKKLITDLKTEKTELTVNLPVGEKYLWTVNQIENGCLVNKEQQEEFSFDLLQEMQSPVITQKGYSIIWTSPKNVEKFDYTLEKMVEIENGRKKEWKVEQIVNNTDSNVFLIDRNLSLGAYRIKVIAKSKFSQSKPSTLAFTYYKPQQLDTKIAFSTGYIILHKHMVLNNESLAASFDGYLLNNFNFNVSASYKNAGLLYDYQKGQKTVFFRNVITKKLLFFKMFSDKTTFAFTYDHMVSETGIHTKIKYTKEKLNLFSVIGPLVAEVDEDTTLFGVEIGPKYLVGPIEYSLSLNYESLMSAKPYKISPYTQYGLRASLERFLNDNLSIGMYLHYGNISFNYVDEYENLFTTSTSIQNMGFYLKWTIH